jgi:hypothetical protein
LTPENSLIVLLTWNPVSSAFCKKAALTFLEEVALDDEYQWVSHVSLSGVEIQRQGEHRIGFHVPGRGHFVSKS